MFMTIGRCSVVVRRAKHEITSTGELAKCYYEEIFFFLSEEEQGKTLKRIREVKLKFARK